MPVASTIYFRVVEHNSNTSREKVHLEPPSCAHRPLHRLGSRRCSAPLGATPWRFGDKSAAALPGMEAAALLMTKSVCTRQNTSGILSTGGRGAPPLPDPHPNPFPSLGARSALSPGAPRVFCEGVHSSSGAKP